MRARVSTSAYHFDFRARCGGTRHLATSNQQPATNNRIVPRLRKRAHAETGRVPDPTIRRGSTSALGLPHEQCASRLLSPRGVDPAVAWYLRRPRPRASRRHARRGAGGERLPPDGARRRVAARPRHVQRPVAADVDDDGVAPPTDELVPDTVPPGTFRQPPPPPERVNKWVSGGARAFQASGVAR